MSENDTWSTVRLVLSGAWQPGELGRLTSQIEDIAAVLAGRDDVGGVETRDPTCIADGPEFVAVDRPELTVYTTPDARERVEAAALALAAAQGLEVTAEASNHEGDDWRDAWKRHYRPLRFTSGLSTSGTQLLIRPSWIPRSPGDPPLELVMDPGRAFGTGLHESTRLCLRALVELADVLRDDRAPRRVLDLGCGSGILGLAAARLWPALEQLVLADHDIEAVETTRENAALNDLQDRVDTRQLSLGDDESLPSELLGADLLLANIRPSVLVPAAPALMAASAGVVILSGILIEEADDVRAAYAPLAHCVRVTEADWCALVLARQPLPLGTERDS